MIDAIQNLIRKVSAEEIMPRFLKVGGSKKSDGTLFTEADIAAQDALSKGLKELADYPILGEEMSDKEHRRLWAENPDGLWIIDPIDGTTNFVHGIPHFAISVALMKNRQSVYGAIYQPMLDEMYTAVLHQGAWLNGTPLPLLHKKERTLAESVASVEVKYLRNGTLAKRMQNLSPCASQRNMGASTLDWCYLAAGRFDVYLHGGQKLWDYAAGSLIFTESGGKIATLENDDFWSGEHTFKRSVIAALQPHLFDAWLKWIRSNQ